MPRLIHPMKDAQNCDKPGGAVTKRLLPDFRMGKPTRVKRVYPIKGRTLSELKYLSRKGKEIKLEIPRVATSETGTAQTHFMPRSKPL